MKIRILLALCIVSSGLMVAPAHALDEGCSIDGGSAANAHMEDPVGDGFLSINVDPSLGPYDSSDVTKVWFSREEDGKVLLHVSLSTSLPGQTNIVYYVLWDFRGSDDAIKTTRMIRLQPRAYGDAYRYGYFDPTPSTTGTGTYRSEGDTTGSYSPGSPPLSPVAEGAPGEITAVVPFDKLGNPGPGDVLANLHFASGVLVGSTGLPNGVSLPVPNPLPLSALVEAADDSTNAELCEEITV